MFEASFDQIFGRELSCQYPIIFLIQPDGIQQPNSAAYFYTEEKSKNAAKKISG
jgi:hypothetical protein